MVDGRSMTENSTPVLTGFVVPAVVPVGKEPGGDVQDGGDALPGFCPHRGGGDEPADGAFDGGFLLFGVNLYHLLSLPRSSVGQADGCGQEMAGGD